MLRRAPPLEGRPMLLNLSILNLEMSFCVAPSVTRSATISPITLENLKPCPEHGLTSTTLRSLGWKFRMKRESGELV